MSAREKEESVGYRRPPKSSQWKKGQSGNPRKVRGSNSKKIWQMVEDVFAMEVAISENGLGRPGTVFEAVSLHLWMQATSRNKRALRALRKYEAFAKTKPDFRVVSADNCAEAAERYARMLAGDE
jgi:hypothetical protein